MSGSRLPQGALLWSGSFAAVLAAHLGLAAYVLARDIEPLDGVAGTTVSIELAPDPSADELPPDEVAAPSMTESAAPSDTPEASEAEPPAPDAPPPAVAELKPEPPPPPELTVPEVPPVPEAEVVLPPTPEKPPEPPPKELTQLEVPPEVPPPDQALKELQRRDTQESQARAASTAALAGGRRPSAAAEQSWRGAIGLHLAKNRRYPSDARERGQQGTATVRVTLDGSGRVLERDLVKSSGQPLLDQEALALMLRAQPMPRPPAGLPTPIVMNVPVRFTIR